MSTPNPTPTQQADGSLVSDDEHDWRGVAAESREDLSAEAGGALKARSRALLGELLRPYRGVIALLAVVVVLENLARLAVPKLVQVGIDKGVPPLQSRSDAGPMTQVLVALVCVIAIQAVTRILFLTRSGRVGQDVLLELRGRVFRHFQRLDVAFHDKYTSGRVVSRMTSDIEAIQEMLATGFDGLVNAVLTMVGTAVLLVVLDWRMGLYCLLCFPPLLALLVWFSRASTATYRRVRESSALVIVNFIETMVGIRAVQAYRRERRNQTIFEGLADRYAAANESSFRLIAVFMPGIKLIGNLTTTFVLVYGGWRVMNGDLTVGVLTAFLLYLRMFFEPMQEISQFYNTFQSASSALEKLSGVLEEQPTVVQPATPRALADARGRLDLDHVHFAYTPERVVIPDLDLHVPAGQTVALVGTTGAGKTTIAKLVARFYDPTSGRVLLDGIDLRELADDDLRRHVVMVTQENVIFEGTVADNIRFGRPDATDAEVQAAARAVGADVVAEQLPQGYDTDLGKRGGRLSAGQRQLVAFARAFLADPAVLILDEATSSLDIPSERLVQQALTTLLADRTAIIIAHRLSTVEIADRVLVLEHGRVLEDGSPAELVGAEGGRYASLHTAWKDSLA